ncbi:HlyD family efflux transporter periplasmic adaptor subunit [Shewanella algae]|uniref:HlyD family secretion protein n=1 Tax=Shewanella algae TaxID=38313 RepID=UPI001641CEAE|nr:HlyD family efflux transporter periplasmic adaptor subunit [Shewanella algae]MBO2556302.1 HlyD family efflux transporter periplasmic adaptor subunit [Shewanella algae]MBO2573235.1 HlyD family efflux transporter periplasmic adaptor subunit [Shewanella algae]MDV2960950.1 HlyD family efflux transporter periplasmic adaptor subunit [Shewanella algae]QNH98652.1 HlyD family efflux transporter periplasmic adaptor subunit [Shewanella algae]
MNKISLILTATLLLLQACGDSGESRAMGTLERDRIQLSAPVAEQIADIHVAEGDKVEAGQLLLQLDSRSAAARVAQRRAELAEAGARLDELQQGARVEERRAARAAIEAATAAATEARLRYQRTRELFTAKVVGQAELDAAIAERDHTKALVEQANEQWLQLENGTRSEQLAQAEARVAAAAAALKAEEKALDDLSLRAPLASEVDILPWKRGDRVAQGTQLVALLALDKPYARVYLPQTAISKLSRGDKLEVWVDGVEQPLKGTVRNIRSQPAFTPFYALNERDRARLMYLTDIDVEGAESLPSGLALEVRLP